eukprot:4580801-Alexandrium_andersonii.AAC.1
MAERRGLGDAARAVGNGLIVRLQVALVGALGAARLVRLVRGKLLFSGCKGLELGKWEALTLPALASLFAYA